MKREVNFSKEELYKGVDKLAKAVGSTLGPKGRPVLIQDDHGIPYVTKDGVTVARHTVLPDPKENLGARLVAQAAQATVSKAGDGTTTSTVLAHAIINSGQEGIDFIKGIEKASLDVVEHLESAKSDLTEELLRNIAYISTNNDAELSEVISEAFLETGEDGIVDVSFRPTATSVGLEVKAGSYIPAGYTHQHFITNMRQRTAEIEDAVVVISNATFDELGQIVHILREPIKEGKSLIIIGDTEKNFNESFVANVEKGIFKGAIVNPGAHVSIDMLKDLATLLGGIYFDNSNGNSFDYLSSNYLGKVNTAVISQDYTLFTIDSNDHVQEKVKELKEMIENGEESFLGDYKSRLSMLNGKYATITVGAPTQARAMEIKDRLDDAVFAVGAAQKFGYLPGGGVALRDAAKTLKEANPQGKEEEGYNALLGALLAPYELILSNAGLEDKEFAPGRGFDASNGEEVDMVEAGIIDPAFVSINAIQNATSAATTLLSLGATLIIADEKS